MIVYIFLKMTLKGRKNPIRFNLYVIMDAEKGQNQKENMLKINIYLPLTLDRNESYEKVITFMSRPRKRKGYR